VIVWLLFPVALVGLAALAVYMAARLEQTSGKALRGRQAEQPLAHELPYWTFLEDTGYAITVGVDLAYCTFLELEGLDTDCMDNEALNVATGALQGVFQILPVGCVLQVLHTTDGDIRTIVERYRLGADATQVIGTEFVEAKATHILETGGLRRNRLVLAVSLPKENANLLGVSLPFVDAFPPVDEGRHKDTLRRLRTLREQVVRALQSMGVHSRPVALSELRRQIYTILNPGRARTIEDPFTQVSGPPRGSKTAVRAWDDSQLAREQLVYAGLREERDRLLLDGHWTRVLTLHQMPSFTCPAHLDALLVNLPFFCRIAFSVEVLDAPQALDQLKKKRDRAHMLATLRERRNQEAEEQEYDATELIQKTLTATTRPVRISLSVVLSVDATRPEAELHLERQTAEVLRVMHSLQGAQSLVDQYNQVDEFLATLPGNASRGRRFRPCTSENAAHLIPCWQSWSGSDAPVLLLQNGRGNLVGLNPFQAMGLDNPNAFMAGTSGSGKSVTTNYLLLNLLATGAGVLIVDVGGSYRRLIELFGGHYFALDLDAAKATAINPFFEPKDILLPDGTLDKHRVQLLEAAVERMLCSDPARTALRNTERSVLGRAMVATYAATSGRAPVLSDLVHVLRSFQAEDAEDVAIARTLSQDLRYWTEGTAGQILNRPSTLKLTTDLAAFDLKGLETQPHIQAVVMVVLSGLIWNLVMRSSRPRKMVVFDEVWRLLESPSSAKLIEELYRTSRKYHCSILTISQSVEDFTNSPIVTPIVQNSATVYLLRHRRGHAQVAQQFRLNLRERHIFENLEMRRGEYTEVLVLHGDHRFLGRVVLTPLEYWIATTHKPDRDAEDALIRQHPHASRLDLLQELARRYPRGVEDAAEEAAGAA
jgi:conjugal transfer ATP-binding protein TraC